MKNLDEKQAKQRLRDGWIRALVTFEVVGRPEKHVVDALEGYLANLRQDERIGIIEDAREKPVLLDDGLFSTFAEAEIMVKDLETFTWLCLNFSPASIEILEPEQLEFSSQDLGNWLNDLLSKLHEIGADYRNQKGAREHLTVAMNSLVKNAVLLAVRDRTRTSEEIAQDVGIDAGQLQPFLDHLVEKGKMGHRDGAYGMPDPAAKIRRKK